MAPAKDPWWQATKTPKLGFLFGAWSLLLAAYWIVEVIVKPRVASLVLAVGFSIVALAYLASAVRLRRQRSGEDGRGQKAGLRQD